uniref:Uncharacterized protein n=1 Tax=Rhizophora mucronata TaxID=61149 RepID=A0A2P2MNA0_RHIMU
MFKAYPPTIFVAGSPSSISCYVSLKSQLKLLFPIGTSPTCYCIYFIHQSLEDFCIENSRRFHLLVQVCRVCGLLGYYNQKLRTGICSTCKSGDNISTMKLPYACKLLIQV